MRWFVGDVQGCARELDDLLRLVRFDPDDDELWSVGDLVNRGPDSLETLRLWRDIEGNGVLGNHDIHALLSRTGTRRRRKDTLETLFSAPDADALLQRLRDLPVLVPFSGGPEGRDVWAVHAGLDPRWRDLHETAERINTSDHDDDWLESADVTFATCVRCCTVEGRRYPKTGPPEDCPPPFAPWDSHYGGPDWIVHGHWARRGYYRGKRTLGLDSGCVYGGCLTAWCLEEDRIAQVPSRASGHGPVRFDLRRHENPPEDREGPG